MSKLSVSLSADISKFQKGMDDAVKITKGTAKSVTADAAKIGNEFQHLYDRIGNAKSLTTASRGYKELLGQMDRMGQGGTAAYRAVLQEAGKLQDTLQDTKGMIDAAAPGGAWRTGTKLLQGSAQAFAGLQGAAALFGSENAAVQKTLLKVQAAMAFVEGMKSIETLKDSFNEMGAVIKAKVIPALSTMKGALIATGVGAIIVGLALVVNYFSDMADKAELAAQAVSKAGEAALKFANDVQGLDSRDMALELAKAKRRGASELELYNIRKKYSLLYQKDLVAAQKKDLGNLEIAAKLKGEQISLEVDFNNTMTGINADAVDKQEKATAKTTELTKKATATRIANEKKAFNDLRDNNQRAMELALSAAELINATELEKFNIRKEFSDKNIELLKAEQKKDPTNVDNTKEILDAQHKMLLDFNNTTISIRAKGITDAKQSATDLNTINEQGLSLEISQAKLRGNNELELYNIRKKYSDLHIANLQAQQVAGIVNVDLDKQIKAEQIAGQVDFNNTMAGINATAADKAKKIRDDEVAAIKKSADEMTNLVKSSISSLAVGVGEAIGNAFAGTEDLMEGIGKAFLGALTGFLTQFGTLLIAAGVAKVSLEAIGITGVGAVIAGIALIAAASAANAFISQKQKPSKFAAGGVVGGNSFAGDRLPALVNSGEMILNKSQQANLFNMAQGGGGGSVQFGDIRLKGQDLYLAWQYSQRNFGR